MASLIPEHEWLEDVVYRDELTQWDSARSECCTTRSFKLHLSGTPADPWNTSAVHVFTDDFLLTHANLYPDVWSVRYMVLKKARAHVKSLIKRYKLKHTTKPAREAFKVMQNRRERKAAVRRQWSLGGCLYDDTFSQLYHRRRDVTFLHPQMERQRRMLEDLGIDGMSSDEEEIANGRKLYLILTPEWRDPILVPWLRIFDGLVLYHRREADAVDGQGRMPRQRVTTNLFSASKRFVSGLPINAYKKEWLAKQLDIQNVIHPRPEERYTHDPALAM